MYIWQRADWPRFRQDQARLTGPLAPRAMPRGGCSAGWRHWASTCAAKLSTLTENVVKTSEIEGEFLAPDRVRRRLRAASDWMPAACRPRTAMSTASWI